MYKELFFASALTLHSALPAAAFDGTVVILEATEARLECQNAANPLSAKCSRAEALEALLIANGYCFNHELAPWRKGKAIPESGGYCDAPANRAQSQRWKDERDALVAAAIELREPCEKSSKRWSEPCLKLREIQYELVDVKGECLDGKLGTWRKGNAASKEEPNCTDSLK